MRPFLAFFTLIRWKNILIVAVAQLLIWACVLLPLEQRGIVEQLFLTPQHFALLCFSTLLLAAAGYIINDYFDIRIDLRNRPEKVIIGKIIKQRWAMFWHSLFNVVGICIAFYLAWQIGNSYLVLVQVFTSILLWWYSTHLKRMYVSGNICVALLTALSVATLLFYEPGLYGFWRKPSFLHQNLLVILNPVYFIGIYIYFAFFLSWIREIVKDMEDFKGDAEEGCVTMPIKIGLQKTNFWIYSIALATLLPVLFSIIMIFKTAMRVQDGIYWILFALYISIFILVPIVQFMWLIGKNTTAVHYEKMSKRLKWIMVLGLLTLPIYYFLHY